MTAAPVDALPELLVHAALVVCATAARAPVLTRAALSPALAPRAR
jgi:glutamyl-tRNA reductase